MVDKILKAVETVSGWAGAMAAVLIFGIAVLIAAEIACRAFLGISLSFAWEYSGYFLATSIFFGAAYTMHTGGHVRLALFRDLLDERMNRAMDLLATSVGALVAFVISYSLILFAWRSFIRGSVSPTVDATPLVIPQAAVAFGATLLALQLLVRTLRLVRREPPEDEAAREKFTVD